MHRLAEQMPTEEELVGESGNEDDVPKDTQEIVLTKVDHVFSNNTLSSIFRDIYGYFERFSPDDVINKATQAPEEGSVFHYHRPQMETALKAPSVVTVHHDLADTDSFFDFKRFEGPYRSASRIVCLCNAQQNWLSDHGFRNTTVIPHGYNPHIFEGVAERRRNRVNEKTVLGFTSRRYDRRVKGEAVLYELAKRLPREKIAFLLVGPERTRDAILLHELGFEVRVYEHLPYRLYARIYEAIDALLILSWHEGGPANVPEAVSTATPIIGTRVGMVLDYVNNEKNGLLLSGDTDSDAEMIKAFANNEQGLRERIDDGAWNSKGSVITWEEVVHRYVDVYREVAASAKSKSRNIWE